MSVRKCFLPVFFVCFKQKTAYEMRISDWSSDVCSSDLRDGFVDAALRSFGRRQVGDDRRHPVGAEMRDQVVQCLAADVDGGDARAFAHESLDAGAAHAGRGGGDDGELAVQTHGIGPQLARSEEHTSELQSLMRISYAVFCLKK